MQIFLPLCAPNDYGLAIIRQNNLKDENKAIDQFSSRQLINIDINA